jgi:hypothetical protein
MPLFIVTAVKTSNLTINYMVYFRERRLLFRIQGEETLLSSQLSALAAEDDIGVAMLICRFWFWHGSAKLAGVSSCSFEVLGHCTTHRSALNSAAFISLPWRWRWCSFETLGVHWTTWPYSPDRWTTRPYSPDHWTTRPYSPNHRTTRPYSSDHWTTRPYSPDYWTTRPYSPDHWTTRPYSPDHWTNYVTICYGLWFNVQFILMASVLTVTVRKGFSLAECRILGCYAVVILVRTDPSVERVASIIMVTRICELRTKLAVIIRLVFTANVVSSSPNLVILMIEAICSSETLVLWRATRHHIPEDGVLPNHRHENLKSYRFSLVIPIYLQSVTVYSVSCVKLM